MLSSFLRSVLGRTLESLGSAPLLVKPKLQPQIKTSFLSPFLRLFCPPPPPPPPPPFSNTNPNGNGNGKLPRLKTSRIGRYVFDEKDLESEEALLNLYQRWIDHYRLSRRPWSDPEEKMARLEIFKKNAKKVYDHNRSDTATYNLPLCVYSDSDPDKGYPFDRKDLPPLPESMKMPMFNKSDIYCSKEDSESDEKLRDLYEKWLSRYNLLRTPSEKHERFEMFKETAKRLHRIPLRPSGKRRFLMDKYADSHQFARIWDRMQE